MRKSMFILGLAPVLLAALPTEANSRGFAWFFAHSGPEGNCSGQHVVATLYSSGSRTASGQAFNAGGRTAVTVVINDRGPFTRGVTLDLASGAAHAIGMSQTQWVCML